MPFIKMHVCGNDFIILDGNDVKSFTAQDAKQIANRKTGIGCDQVLLIKNFDNQSNFTKIDIYNRDGSVAETCINGTLCVARYLMHKHKIENIKICSFCDVLICSRGNTEDEILLELPEPTFDWQKINMKNQCNTLSIEIFGIKERGIALALGNPHIIFFTSEKNGPSNILNFAKKVNDSRIFAKGVNISVCFIDGNKIYAKVFERGAGLTLSCGSAASAIYFAGIKSRAINFDDQVFICFPGGMTKIFFSNNKVLLSTKVNTVFIGLCINL